MHIIFHPSILYFVCAKFNPDFTESEFSHVWIWVTFITRYSPAAFTYIHRENSVNCQDDNYYKHIQSKQVFKLNLSALIFKDCFTRISPHSSRWNSASHDNWCTATLWNRLTTAQCEGMGEVGSARYEPALLPPCPGIRVLSYSNCQRSTQSHQQFKG